MRYRSVLLLTELGADPEPALVVTRGLAPAAESLVVLASSPAQPSAWRLGERDPGPRGAASAWLEGVRGGASGVATRVQVALLPELDADALEEVVAASSVDLVVAGPRPSAAIPILAGLRKRHGVSVAWLPASAAPRRDRPFTELVCVALGSRAEASLAVFLRDHGEPTLHVRVLSLARPSPGELAAALDVSGVRAFVELEGRAGLAPWQTLGTLARERPVDLVVLARFPGFLLRSAPGAAPILVLPPLAPVTPAVERPLDVPDPVDVGGVVRVRLGRALGIGRNPPIPDQPVAFVSSGQLVAVVTTKEGEAELPPGLVAESLGVFRVRHRPGLDPLAAVERRVTVVRPGPLPLVLFDAELPDADLSALAGVAGAEPLAVRLRPVRSCHVLRGLLGAKGLAPRVIDASTLLDEGPAEDVCAAHDAVRLARVAVRMRRAGFLVAAIVHRGPHAPTASGLAMLRAQDVASRSGQLKALAPPPDTPQARFDVTTDAAPVAGNHIEIEVDNVAARRWLLAAIEGARRRVHLQTYMAADDDVGRQVEAALREAGKRGVDVRVLVDSLHGLHGSFGMRNPLLERLSADPGVELRVSRPVAGIPSLEDLKQRDHRKLMVADGRLALLGGRNVAHEYYTGLNEVAVTARTPWREVPWLDAGARVEGPAVAAIEHSFLEAWTGAGGSSFEILGPPPVGPTSARVVVHRGLRDAATLEAYLAIIESARSHVYVVHSFPLVLEIQHALLRAIRRGVRVRALFGHVAPTHGSQPFEGDWATARALATWFVHSRMDALVAAGGEGYEAAVRDVPGWAPDLGLVQPHVHAKAMSADGLVCAVGSANMDVTGCYWEDELSLVVEDAALARAFEARIDEVIAGSVRVDREDPNWQRLARRREWMRHWPGVLSA